MRRRTCAGSVRILQLCVLSFTSLTQGELMTARNAEVSNPHLHLYRPISPFLDHVSSMSPTRGRSRSNRGRIGFYAQTGNRHLPSPTSRNGYLHDVSEVTHPQKHI